VSFEFYTVQFHICQNSWHHANWRTSHSRQCRPMGLTQHNLKRGHHSKYLQGIMHWFSSERQGNNVNSELFCYRQQAAFLLLRHWRHAIVTRINLYPWVTCLGWCRTWIYSQEGMRNVHVSCHIIFHTTKPKMQQAFRCCFICTAKHQCSINAGPYFYSWTTHKNFEPW
jgi:hypothetical protein